jgi:hypothetical protein
VRVDVPMTLSATSRDEKVVRRTVCADFRALGGALRCGYGPNRSLARVALCAVASGGLKPSRAVSNRLRPVQPFWCLGMLPAVP